MIQMDTPAAPPCARPCVPAAAVSRTEFVSSYVPVDVLERSFQPLFPVTRVCFRTQQYAESICGDQTARALADSGARTRVRQRSIQLANKPTIIVQLVCSE